MKNRLSDYGRHCFLKERAKDNEFSQEMYVCDKS
jgi:hypothetical protein